MNNVPIGLQLYSVREACAADLPSVLREVAAMGYAGVEFAGYHGYGAEDLRRMLDDLGLRCCGTHTGLDTLLGDAFDGTAEFNKALGNPYLIVPALPEERYADLNAWKRTAELFNEIDDRAEAAGMRVGYHNHWVEFESADGTCPWDVFFGTARERVIMQLDTGNALRAGVDVTPYVERFPGRAVTVHLKDYARDDPSALLGEGEVAWTRLFELCEGVGGTEWYIVEQESSAHPPMECVRRCLEALRAMGK